MPLLSLAQRAFCAAAILARPSVLIRLFRLVLTVDALAARGRPRLLCVVPFEPDKISLARCKRSSSASIAAKT